MTEACLDELLLTAGREIDGAAPVDRSAALPLVAASRSLRSLDLDSVPPSNGFRVRGSE